MSGEPNFGILGKVLFLSTIEYYRNWENSLNDAIEVFRMVFSFSAEQISKNKDCGRSDFNINIFSFLKIQMDCLKGLLTSECGELKKYITLGLWLMT